MAFHSSEFGNDFIWGVASSAYQTEGSYLVDGKGLSIWDVFTSIPGKIHLNQNASVACNFYERYIQDLILMHYLNVKNFRFSISWPRIFPDGTGKINDRGIDYYNRVIDFALECGIEPWITLYHWDLPQALEIKGGWTNREIINWFENYILVCLNNFSDRVKNWMVLNEPMAFTGAGYFLGIHAPGKKGLNNFLSSVHHAAICQGLGGHILRSHNGSLNIGTTVSCSHIEPVDRSKLSLEAAQRVDALTNRLFIEPLLGMGYPWKEFKAIQQIEKYFRSGDEKLMEFNMDFIGLQNYTREVIRHSSIMPYLNARQIKASKRNVPTTFMDWEIYPEGIYKILKKFQVYNKIRNIIITENGASFDDKLILGHVDDKPRTDFLKKYLKQVLKAKKEGVPVNGYFVWSFTDNFEWIEGYKQRFGLVYVDYATQKRTIKASGYWYRNFLEKMKQEDLQS